MDVNLDNWPWTEEERKELEEIEKHLDSLPKLVPSPNAPKVVPLKPSRRRFRVLEPEELAQLQEEIRQMLSREDT